MPVAEKTVSLPDYATLIANLERDLADAKDEMRGARDTALRDLAQMKVAEFQRALENAKVAATIPATLVGDRWVADAVQFGFPNANGVVPMAPALDEFASVFPSIRYEGFIYVATDPLEIATLRRTPGVTEVALGSAYARPNDGSPDGVWMPFAQYQQMLEKGMVY